MQGPQRPDAYLGATNQNTNDVKRLITTEAVRQHASSIEIIHLTA